MYCNVIKRIFDIFVASLVLIILFPLLIFLFILIYFFIGKPVFFTQLRPGLHEKPFRLYKFRTMRNLCDDQGKPLTDGERLTTFGKVLRSLSLDELPELINVIKGEMSLIGPRPLLMDYLPFYSEDQRKRHWVRPGITGYAQINGRNSLSWKKKFELDVWYVEHCSFLLDMKILFLTIYKIIKREGINAKGEATMSRFDEEMKKNLS